MAADKPFSFLPRLQNGGGGVSVWGCMTSAGVGPLVFYEGRVIYEHILDPTYKSTNSKLLPSQLKYNVYYKKIQSSSSNISLYQVGLLVPLKH